MNVHKKNLLYLDSFIAHIKNYRKFSIHTIRAYTSDINHLIEYLGDDKLFIELNKYDLHEYVTTLSIGSSSKTLSRKVATLKSIFRFLCDEELIDYNISKSIKIPKVDKRLPNHISMDEMKSFFSKTINEIDISDRDILVIDIIYSTGIRVSECVAIQIKDIDMNKNTIRVIGKGNKNRLVVFGKKTKENIFNYLKSLDINMNDFLFPTKSVKIENKKKPITTRTVYNIVKKYIKLVTRNEKLGPHSLRHSFATHLLQSGSDLMAIKDLLGHESLASTQIYTHLDTKRMKQIYDKSHPHAKK